MTEEIIVTTRHVRAAEMCLIPGARNFFARHNLDFRAFVKEGIDAQLLAATGDAMALAVVAIATKEHELNVSNKNG